MHKPRKIATFANPIVSTLDNSQHNPSITSPRDLDQRSLSRTLPIVASPVELSQQKDIEEEADKKSDLGIKFYSPRTVSNVKQSYKDIEKILSNIGIIILEKFYKVTEEGLPEIFLLKLAASGDIFFADIDLEVFTNNNVVRLNLLSKDDKPRMITSFATHGIGEIVDYNTGMNITMFKNGLATYEEYQSDDTKEDWDRGQYIIKSLRSLIDDRDRHLGLVNMYNQKKRDTVDSDIETISQTLISMMPRVGALSNRLVNKFEIYEEDIDNVRKVILRLQSKKRNDVEFVERCRYNVAVKTHIDNLLRVKMLETLSELSQDINSLIVKLSEKINTFELEYEKSKASL